MKNRWLVGVFALLLLSSCASKRRHGAAISPEDKRLLEKYSAMTLGPLQPTDVSLVRFMDAWWGVPHKIGGSDQQGTDCSGFLFRLYQEVYGREIPRTTDALFKAATVCDTADLVMGDLVFVVFQGRQKVSHVGVYLQNGRFVHASTSKGVRIDYMRDTYYRKQKFIGGKLP